MDLQKLKYFVTIVESGSVSQAAKVLNMTQPPLSMLLKKFENDLGVQLFTREGKRLHLTDSGTLLYRRGIELLASAEEIIQETQEFDQDKRSNILVGNATIANFTFIPEVMKRMHERNMNITVHVREGSTPYILDHLRYHKLDIGIVRNVYHQDDIITTPLLTEEVMVALPPHHPLSNRTSIHLEELKNDPFLLYNTAFEFNVSDLVIKAAEKCGFTPNIVYWGTETLPMLGLVNAGLGVSFVPKSTITTQYYNLPTLIDLAEPTIKTTMNIVSLKKHSRKDAILTFQEILNEVITEFNEEHTFLL